MAFPFLASRLVCFFFFNDTATTEIYTLSLHDALPISGLFGWLEMESAAKFTSRLKDRRSEEHTSELQSRSDLVCRLLLEKKKNLKQPEVNNGKKKKNKSTYKNV